MKVRGFLTLELHSASGELLTRRAGANLITDIGKAQFAKLIGQLATEFPNYIALGTDNTAVDPTDTTMTVEITSGGGERGLVDSIVSATDAVTDDTIVLTKVFTFTSSFAIEEAGLFDAAVDGNLFAHRVVSPAVNVVSSNVLTATWTLSFA